MQGRKIQETKITMVRLTPPKLGTETGSPNVPPSTAAKPKAETPAQDIPQAKSAPVPKIPQAQKEKPKAAKKTKAAKKAPTKKIPPKTQPRKTTQKTKPAPKNPSSLKKRGTPQPKTAPVDAPDSAAIAQALAGIDQDLAKRDQALKQSSEGSAQGTGTGASLGSPEGSVTARDTGFVQYQSKVRSKIIRNWVRTHASSNTQQLSARVKVKITASGAVISKALVKRSGDSAFDQSALRAVERASPLPAPPAAVEAEALRDGFVVDFRSRVLGR